MGLERQRKRGIIPPPPAANSTRSCRTAGSTVRKPNVRMPPGLSHMRFTSEASERATRALSVWDKPGGIRTHHVGKRERSQQYGRGAPWAQCMICGAKRLVLKCTSRYPELRDSSCQTVFSVWGVSVKRKVDCYGSIQRAQGRAY